MAGLPGIPSDMLPHMDWNAEDKLAAWTFFKQRLQQYFVIAHTPEEDWVTHILFFGGKEASEGREALKNQLKEEEQTDPAKVFKLFANSFEKSSSHWQARDEYLGDIKQTKHQTTVELDIYIKDLVCRCQFEQGEQESHKIDLFYHATVHLEVRNYVHNTKPEELSCDWMIEVAKAHERTCQEYQIHKQAHSGNLGNYSNPLLQTSALSKSFQKGPPKKPCGKCEHKHNHSIWPAWGTTCGSCGRKNHWQAMCRSSRRRNSSTGCSPSPRQPQQQRQRWQSSNKYSKKSKAGGGSTGYKKVTPKKGGKPQKPHKVASLTITRQLSGPSHPPKVMALGSEGNVSKPAGITTPAHPPKVSGEHFVNTFVCNASVAMAMRSLMTVIRNTRSVLTQTVMAKQRS